MSVELTHNNHRYMVENGQWYRRLEVGDLIANEVEVSVDSGIIWHQAIVSGVVTIRNRDIENGGHYRVPCTDTRPPFVVGQMVKVARVKENEWGGTKAGGRLAAGETMIVGGNICLAVNRTRY